MANSLLSWRNWVFETGDLVAPPWYPFLDSAQLSNLRTPQQLKVAKRSETGETVIQYEFEVNVGRPVGVIALLNHNIVDPGDTNNIQIEVTDASGEFITANMTDIVFNSGYGSQILPSLYLFPQDVLGGFSSEIVNRIVITISSGVTCGTIDPYTDDITPEPFQAGVLWAGPAWRPVNGIKFAALQQGITENARGVYSIGGQFYPQPQPRQRLSSFEFGGLLEDEVYSTWVNYPSLQQMASWCARSRPLIVIPQNDDDELVYAMGVYGYLTQDPTWTHQDGFMTSTKEGSNNKRMYQAGLQMREAL